MGPTWARTNSCPAIGEFKPIFDHRQVVGFSPATPQNEAGKRIEPPRSVPSPSTLSPLASNAPSPPLDPPRHVLRAPGVAGGSEDRVGAVHREKRLGYVRLPQHDGPGLAGQTDDHRVPLCRPPHPSAQPHGAGRPLCVDILLYGERQTVQGAPGFAARPLLVRAQGLAQRLGSKLMRKAVDVRLHLVRPMVQSLHDLDGAELAPLESVAHLTGCHLMDVHESPSCLPRTRLAPVSWLSPACFPPTRRCAQSIRRRRLRARPRGPQSCSVEDPDRPSATSGSSNERRASRCNRSGRSCPFPPARS